MACYNKFMAQYSELLGFWTLSIMWSSKNIRVHNTLETDLFLSSGEGRDTYTVHSISKN
jgi:hypothetical protein